MAFFVFDENIGTLLTRGRALGMDIEPWIERGLLHLQQVDPAELSPGEFTAAVRHSVEVQGAGLVVLDSLNGYLHAMPDGKFLVLQMHELLSYLGQKGVVTIMVLAQHGLVGVMDTPIDISYLSDAVIMQRYFEHAGIIRRALSVVKAQRAPREHHPRIPLQSHRHPGRAAPESLQRHPFGHTGIHRRCGSATERRA